MLRCTHCTEKNQDCRFEAVTEEEKVKAQSYKSRLMRRRRQACVFWDVLPASAVHSQQQHSPSSPTSMIASMTIASASAPTSPDLYQHSSAFHDSPVVPTANDDAQFQQYLYHRHAHTYQSLATPFDSPDSLPRMPHTSYNETTINPFFQHTAAALSSSMTPSRSSPVQQMHDGMQYPCINEQVASPFAAAAPALSPASFSSPALSVSSPTSALVTPKGEYSVDYSSFMVQQQASQYRLSAGLGLHDLDQAVSNMGTGGFNTSSMALLPSVMMPAPADTKPLYDAGFFAPLAGEHASATYCSAPRSTLDSAGLIRPYALNALPLL